MSIKPDYKTLYDVIINSDFGGERKKKISQLKLKIEISKTGYEYGASETLEPIIVTTNDGNIIGDDVVGYFKDLKQYFAANIDCVISEIERITEEKPKYGGGYQGVFC